MIKNEHMQNFSLKTANLDQFKAKKPQNLTGKFLRKFERFFGSKMV